MPTDRSSREWMQELARLRAKAARQRTASSPDPQELLALVYAALDLTDALRLQCATLQTRNAELEMRAIRAGDETRALIDALPHAVIQTDCAGQIVDANPAASALLGVSPAKLRNELLLHFTENRAAFTTVIRELPRAQTPMRAAARIRPRDRAPYEADLTVLRDPRSGDDRWIWVLEKVSAARTPGRSPSPGEAAPSPSDLWET